ncbi:MAG: hypothetical protein ACR2H5_13950 [Ktedonobacteraceae bacterium]
MARHSLIIYRNIVITVIFLIIGSITTIGIIGGNTYVETCCGFIIFFCAIFLIVLIVYFFTDGMDTGGRYGFYGISRIKELFSLKEKIEAAEMAIRIYQQHQTLLLSIEEQTELYKDNLLQSIQEYQSKGNWNRWFYFSLQMVTIACSLFVGGLTSGLSNSISIFGSHWLAPILSFTVSFLTALITLFRPRERGYSL